jgi:hypothetical protein
MREHCHDKDASQRAPVVQESKTRNHHFNHGSSVLAEIHVVASYLKRSYISDIKVSKCGLAIEMFMRVASSAARQMQNYLSEISRYAHNHTY